MGLLGFLKSAAAAVFDWFIKEFNQPSPTASEQFYHYSSGATYNSSYSLPTQSSYTYSGNSIHHVEPTINIKPRAKLRQTERLQIYRPNEDLLASFMQNSAFHKDKFIGQKLSNRTLNWNNFHDIFKSLVELEDVEELSRYQHLIQNGVELKHLYKKTFTVKFLTNNALNMEEELTPYCDEVIVIPHQARNSRDILELLAPGNDKEYSKNIAIITDVTKSEVVFNFFNSNHIKDLKVDLIFRPRRDYIRYQQRALQLLAKNIKMPIDLFPVYNSYEIPWQLDKKQLLNETISKNPEQLEAVKTIVSGLRAYMPYIVFGPPGTGKTTTIVEAILQLRLQYLGSRILVTSGSNSACDTIADRLCNIIDTSEKYKFGEFPILRIFSKGYSKEGIQNIPKCFYNNETNCNLYWDNGLPEYPAIEDANKYDIVVMTLCTLGKYELSNFCASKGFTHIFIDEAGSISEPEALIGIMAVSSVKATNVILSGDHKQLGPVIKSEAKDLGLGKSLMERLMESDCYKMQYNGEYDKSLQIRLKRNYRSDPEIVKLYNKLYYDNELIATPTEENAKQYWSFLPNPKSPIMFQAVYGRVVKEKTTSSSNKLEIEILMAYIRHLLEYDNVSQSDIGIITPYKLQCKLITNYLEKENYKKIEVGTVENFQGREKLIIIASMVRSFKCLGFVKCPRRWNVLLSRPKSLLIVLGNPMTLNTFEDIKFVIDECELAGNYLGRKNLKLIENSKIQIKLSRK